jgi:hypothetical protein
MSILTVKEIQSNLQVKEGELRLDHRLFCQGLGLDNSTSYRTNILDKYEDDFARFGVILKMTLDTGEIVWFLNEDQVNFAGTLARNTEQAVQFKAVLVQAFKLARENIREKIEQALAERPTLKQIDQVGRMLGKRFGKAYEQQYVQQKLQHWYPALSGQQADLSQVASLPSTKHRLIPRDIAKELGLFHSTGNPNGNAANVLLESLGYQSKVGKIWIPSDKAIADGLVDRKPVDTNSATQKDQILWSADILPILREHSLVVGG